MSAILLSVVAFAALFAGFGLLNRGREGRRGCGSCDSSCGHDCGEHHGTTLRELK